ncbi:MAG: DUF4381 domain-containing protein [Pseudomonadales bacterium]
MQMPGAANPLEQLRDIHLPPDVPAWPPAIGWWFVAGLALILLLVLLARLWHRWRANAYRREALRACQLIEDRIKSALDYRSIIIEIATLLKRTALTAFPRSEVAVLSGDAWILFLEARGGGANFSVESSTLLVETAFGSQPAQDIRAVSALLGEAQAWIRSHQRSPVSGTGDRHA